jgi:hypothetical protein
MQIFAVLKPVVVVALSSLAWLSSCPASPHPPLERPPRAPQAASSMPRGNTSCNREDVLFGTVRLQNELYASRTGVMARLSAR